MKNAKQIITYWVVFKDGSQDLTVPFEAADKKHAEEWIAQGYVEGLCKIVKVRAMAGVCDECGREFRKWVDSPPERVRKVHTHA